MFAMKTVKTKPEHVKYAITEKKILENISHVSHQTLGRIRKPAELTRILHAESKMTPHPPNNILWHFSPKILPITLLQLVKT
jgi:hypothetical protein